MLLYIVKEVESFKFDYTELIVSYKVNKIIPWSKDKIDRYVHKNRLSNFKVIVGGKESS